MTLTPQQKQQNRIDKMMRKFAAYTPQECKAVTAKSFQKMIRIEAADDDGICTCVSSGRRAKWNSGAIHAGHFIAGRRLSVIFDERNCHCQYWVDNMHRGGNQAEYTRFMLAEYGQDVIDDLIRESKKDVSLTKEQFVAKRIGYMDRIKKALQRLGE